MKYTRSLLGLATLCTLQLTTPAWSQSPAPGQKSPPQAGGKEGYWKGHEKKILEAIPEDLRERFKTARTAALEDPKIQELKKNLMLVGKNIQPMRDMLNKIISGNNDLFETKNVNYFKDIYDHAYLVSENIENQKSLLSDLMNIYLSSMSNRLNQVMKVLTIISTIFMPLSFLTGVFGMNFGYFPGLNNPYAYYYFWGLTVTVVIVMLYYFKRKNWF